MPFSEAINLLTHLFRNLKFLKMLQCKVLQFRQCHSNHGWLLEISEIYVHWKKMHVNSNNLYTLMTTVVSQNIDILISQMIMYYLLFWKGSEKSLILNTRASNLKKFNLKLILNLIEGCRGLGCVWVWVLGGMIIGNAMSSGIQD